MKCCQAVRSNIALSGTIQQSQIKIACNQWQQWKVRKNRASVIIVDVENRTESNQTGSIILMLQAEIVITISVSDALYVVTMLLFWVVTPCRLVGRYHRFGETHCLHL
jgi:hypothetical protein